MFGKEGLVKEIRDHIEAKHLEGISLPFDYCNPARALRALGLLLADGTPTGGRGEDFLSRQPDLFIQPAR